MTASSTADVAPPIAGKDAPHTVPCPGCLNPVEPVDAFCPACGLAGPAGRVAAMPGVAEVAAPPLAGFHCDNCGADVRCDPDSRTATCPFCASPYVVDRPPEATGRQLPEFVIGFECPPERAERIHRAWLGKNGMFRPGDLSDSAQVDGLRGIYLPFWSFSVRADSTWSASIGEHWYTTETYTVRNSQGKTETRTRRVQHTEWWPLRGRHRAFYSFFLISGSKGLPQDVSEWVQPYHLGALKRYRPGYLAGWLSEEYTVEKEQAYDRCMEEFRRREHAAVAAFLPGDTYSKLQVDTTFSDPDSDLILLPIYLRSYRYRGKLYRTLINGQTGKIEGEKPLSGYRIGAAVALALLAALIALILFQVYGR